MSDVNINISRAIVSKREGQAPTAPTPGSGVNPFLPGGMFVQSVRGGVVDNTDPYNPIINTTSLPPVQNSYGSQALMIADQANQLAQYLYFDGTSFWEYLGTTNGNISDYEEFAGGGGEPIIGTPNYLSKFVDPTGLTESQIFDNGVRIGVFTNNPLWDFHLRKSLNSNLELVAQHTLPNRFATNNVLTDVSGCSIASFGSTYPEQTTNGHTSRWAGRAGLYINTGPQNKTLNIWIGTRTMINGLPTGQVAIGQADPQAWLHVQGNLRIDNVPSGTGDSLLIDANGDVVRGAGGGGGGGGGNFIAFDVDQTLTPVQRQKANKNIGSIFTESTINDSSGTNGILESPPRTTNVIVFTNPDLTTIRGLPFGYDGETCRLINRTGRSITLQDNFSSIEITNRFSFGTNMIVPNNKFIDLVWIANTGRWIKEIDSVLFSADNQRITGFAPNTGNVGVLVIRNTNVNTNSPAFVIINNAEAPIFEVRTSVIFSRVRQESISFGSNNGLGSPFISQNTNTNQNVGLFEGYSNIGGRRFWARTNSLILFEDLGTHGFCMKNPTNTAASTVMFSVNAFDNSNAMQIRADKLILFNSLPTTNPLIIGALWNDNGTLKISAG